MNACRHQRRRKRQPRTPRPLPLALAGNASRRVHAQSLAAVKRGSKHSAGRNRTTGYKQRVNCGVCRRSAHDAMRRIAHQYQRWHQKRGVAFLQMQPARECCQQPPAHRRAPKAEGQWGAASPRAPADARAHAQKKRPHRRLLTHQCGCRNECGKRNASPACLVMPTFCSTQTTLPTIAIGCLVCKSEKKAACSS